MLSKFFLIFLFCSPFILHGQETIDPLSRISYNEFSSRLRLIDRFQSNVYYFHLSQQVNRWEKVFICPENIQSITLLDSTQGKSLFSDSIKGTVIVLETNKDFLLLTITELLKLNKIGISNYSNFEIFIDQQHILDSTVLVDSKAIVYPFYYKEIPLGKILEEPEAIGVIIYTKIKEFTKNGR